MENDVIKSQTKVIIETFNNKPQTGISLMKDICQHNALNVAEEIARFFHREKNNLDLEAVGDYLSSPGEEHKKILQYFIEGFDFTGQPFIHALRSYLMSFKLPGEAQKIDRLVEVFANIYWQQNPEGAIKHQDAAYILAFQTIMLNTDLHNSSIKESKKMTYEGLVKQVQGLNTEFALQKPNSGEDFSEDFLKQLYDEIKATPFKFNFVKTAPGYELDDELLKDDQTFHVLNSILSTAHSSIDNNTITNEIYQLPLNLPSEKKSIKDVFLKLKQDIKIAEIDRPKTWLNIFTGYNGTITIQDRSGAKASIQLYVPGIISKWFIGSKPKVIVQPLCEHGKQPAEEAINMAAQIAASFSAPVKNIKSTFDYLKDDLTEAYVRENAPGAMPVNSIDSSPTITRSISMDSGIGLDERSNLSSPTSSFSDLNLSDPNLSDNFSSRQNVIKEASIALMNQFFQKNEIVDESTLVDRIFDNANLSKLAKQQLLNNLLDNNHIRQNKQLTKQEFIKMLMETQFVQQQANSVLTMVRENSQDRTLDSTVIPSKEEPLIPEIATLDVKPAQNAILTDLSALQILQSHGLSKTKTNKESNNLPVKSIITAIEDDFSNIQGYIVQELIKIITATNGNIDTNDENFKVAIEALLNADPQSNKNHGNAVVSLLNSEQTAHEKIEKLITQGADPRGFDALKIAIQNIRTDLEKKLSNVDDIQELVIGRLKQQSLLQLPFSDGTRGIHPREKASIAAMLKPYVVIPDSVCSLLNKNNTMLVETIISPFVQQRTAEFLSVEGNNEKGWCTLDKEKLSSTNLEACGEALNADFAKLLLTQSTNISINVSDLEQYIATAPTMEPYDPITNLVELNLQIHVKGLKSLYDQLQSGSSMTIGQLKQNYARELLSDLEQFSTLEASKFKKLPVFRPEFYQQILKAPSERSAEYNEFINKYAELADEAFIVMKNSARALLEFDKEEQTLEDFKKNFLSAMTKFKASQVEQSEKDYNRTAILYKESDDKIYEISLEELRESSSIALTDEQRDFIATSWNQGTFESGWAMQYLMKQYLMKKANQQEIMPPIVNNRTQILIDVSEGVKVHNRLFLQSMDPDDNTKKIPHSEMMLSVDISNMRGDEFMPGCSTKSPIVVNMNFIDKNAALILPKELVNIMKFSNTSLEIENLQEDAIKAYSQMMCAQYVGDLKTFDNNSFYRGWNNLNKQITPSEAFKAVVKEVYSRQYDNIQKEQVIGEIMVKLEEPSPNNDYVLEPSKALEMFCDVETNNTSRENFASKCLDLFFKEQQISVLDTKAQKYVQESVISVLLPLCNNEEEKKIVKSNVGQMVRECAVQANKELSWAEAWNRFKDKISNVIPYLIGRKKSQIQQLMSKYPIIAQTLANNLSVNVTEAGHSAINVAKGKNTEYIRK